MRTVPSLTAIGSGLVLAFILVGGEALIAPATADAAAPCRVRNLTQGTQGRSLIKMVKRTRDGDKLIVRGTCAGEVVITTDIVIQGKGVTPTLMGRDQTRVVRVRHGATVVLRHLRIQRGWARRRGGGIWNDGRLTLRNVVLRRNEAGTYGGGIHVARGGTVKLIASSVSGNTAREGGGGLFSHDGKVTIIASMVSGNGAGRDGGGGIWTSSGRLSVTDSTISDNTARGVGGGLRSAFGTDTLVRTTISENSGQSGGGIFSDSNSVTLRAVSVRDNAAEYDGGGIWTRSRGFTLIDSKVKGNSAGRRGGGIHVGARVTLTDSTVTGNSAVLEGGGIHAYDAGWGVAMVTLKGTSSVHDNVPNDCVGTPAC